ncbi:hypothetical protein GW17_00015190 [Ensete ventricosum]|nr:hypothetical protein GW17_00015190 [Ensete ventricosum]
MGGWETPKRGDCRIPAAIRCPPPPRKKKRCPTAAGALGKRRGPPRNGYFHPPDLEALFALAQGGGVWDGKNGVGMASIGVTRPEPVMKSIMLVVRARRSTDLLSL